MQPMDDTPMIPYEEFITRLENVFKKKDKTLNLGRLPRLGHKDIDLQVLYGEVIKRGGMTKVSEEKAWRDISLSFDLPKSCTNASFALKQMYMRYLGAYEAMYFPGYRPATAHIVPPSMERSLANSNKPTPMGPKYLPKTPITTAPSSPHPLNLSSRISQDQCTNQQAPYMDQPIPVPNTVSEAANHNTASTAAVQPAALPPPRPIGSHYLGISGIANKISYSLQCGLPNERDWALCALLNSSNEARREANTLLANIPGVLELLIEYGETLVKAAPKGPIKSEEDIFNL
eukprot:Ihof_evm2s1198 gene=Ihof_evmTU2s1198